MFVAFILMGLILFPSLAADWYLDLQEAIAKQRAKREARQALLVGRKSWPERLREAADHMDEISVLFAEFKGTDQEEHLQNLYDAAKQFRDDAVEYEEVTQGS